MTKLFGSYNSRFFASLTPREVRLYRGISAGAGLIDSNEASLVYSRALEEGNDLELIRVGNQGDLFFTSKKGLFRLRNDRNPQFEVVNSTINSLAQGDDSARLGKISVDADGREICYEVITPEGGLKDRFFKLLGGKSGSEAMLAHQVVHYNIGSQRGLNFPPALVETRREFGFYWSCSPGGRFLVLARPEKKVYHLELIDVSEESIIADFQMALASITNVWVNDAGVVMVDVRHIGEEKLIIALPDNKTRHSFCPPPTYRVLHLGPLHVALILESQRRMQIFDYSGNVVADVDFRPLRQLGVEFSFNFNERGDIDILGWQGGVLRIQHTDIKAIPTDAKRWDLTARQQQAETEQQLVHEATLQHKEERRRLEEFQLSRQLLESVQSDAPNAPQPARLPRLGGERNAPAAPIPAPLSEIESIPEAPAPSALPGEVPPWMTGLSARPPAEIAPPPPPPPLEREPAPPEERPQPGSEERSLPRPEGRSLPRPVPPAARPEEPAELPPPPPPPVAAPASLSFLRGGSPLPPPDTETGEASPPAAEPPAPAPVRAAPRLPDPVVEPPPTAPLSGPADLDLELEKLRMSYIAGEIGREAYYSRRAELEGLRRGQQGQRPASAPESGPKRLDLELGGELPAPGPAPTRRRSGEGGLSLELPLPGED